MSNVNPNNIDGGFPIAGQDNDSQGLRDNFTNVKNNLTTIKTELEDLQNKVVLKQALSINNNILNNQMGGEEIPGLLLSAASERYYDAGEVSGSLSINWAAGHLQQLAITAETTLSFTDWPTSGSYAKVRLLVTPAAAPVSDDLILPAEVSIFGDSVLNRTGQTIAISDTTTALYELSTKDAGLTIMMFQLI